MKPNILIIDDEVSIRRALQSAFEKNSYNVTALSSKKELSHVLSLSSHFDLAVLDMILPDANGIELIPLLKKKYSDIQINILTGHGSIDSAIRSMKEGAFHFFTKPFSVNEVLNVCQKALEQTQLKKENEHLKICIKKQYSFRRIIGGSPPILKLSSMIKKVAASEATALIQGESGTGKELVAKAIHFNSSRMQNKFVPVHCGAIPQDLLESELFGHVQGAFTGAYKDREGLFQAAQKGTLFLDEISTMPLSLQVKLLRVLQEKQFEPVGSTKTIYADVRIIAASNSNLEKAVKDNKFRADLFYRLNVIPLYVPPLRERREDIPLLLKTFISEMNKKNKYKISKISAEAVKQLLSYSWPGNIRELENLVERLCVLKEEGAIGLEDLPSQYRKSTPFPPFHISEGLDFKDTVSQFENSLIFNALEKTQWNKHKAARLLKMNRTTLIEKMKKKNITELSQKEANPQCNFEKQISKAVE